MSSDRVVLVTGTSSGIGLHSAVLAAREGWTVVATMRDPRRGDGLRGAAADAGVVLDIRALDVTEPDAAERLVSSVEVDHGRLDAVVNNAGIGTVGTTETLPLEAFRSSTETNFFGVVAVTQAALPRLRATRGRVLTVTSVGGVVGQPFNDAYCAAKFATEGFLESLRPVAATVGVGVAVIEPAAVSSEFVTNARVDRDALLAGVDAYAPALDAYLDRTRGAYATAQTPADAAAVIVEALSRDPLPFRIPTSEAARRFAALKLADLDGSAVTDYTATWVTADASTEEAQTDGAQAAGARTERAQSEGASSGSAPTEGAPMS